MKLSFTQKGMILVVAPLLFQFLFVGILIFLFGQVEKESSRFFHSVNVGNCSNKLIKDVFGISAISHSELIELITTNAYKDEIGMIRTDLNDLSNAASGDPAQEAIVKKSMQAGEEAIMLIEQLRTAFVSGDALNAIDQLKQLRGEFRSCMQRMISKDLLAMADSESQKIKEAHRKQLGFRQQIQLFLIMGLVINAIIAIVITWIFSKKIVNRLKILADNSYRLASKMPLNPLVDGTDEIASVDNCFHQMAISLAEAKQKEKSMIEHSVDVICTLDSQGRITAANPASEHILGYPNDLILGNSLRSILLNEDVDNFNQSLSQAIVAKTERNIESRIKRKDGAIRDMIWSLCWVDSKNSFFCVGHDISERKEIERLKQQFMAMISHDLRTPLSTIANYMEMLSAGLFGELTEKGNHLLHIAENNANRMLALINDLLDLERAEFDGLTIEPNAQSLGTLMDQSVKSVAGLAQQKQIRIELEKSNLTVNADSNRILQVLVNLLSNAIKFSPKDGKVKLWADELDNQAIIYVSDEGRGVPEDMKEKIFEHFQQVEIADAVDKGGSGLGLAICKAIVELHGGTIKVENNNGTGSIFCFSLPLATKQEMAPA